MLWTWVMPGRHQTHRQRRARARASQLRRFQSWRSRRPPRCCRFIGRARVARFGRACAAHPPISRLSAACRRVHLGHRCSLRGQVDRGDEGVEERPGVDGAACEQGEEIEPPAGDDGRLDRSFGHSAILPGCPSMVISCLLAARHDRSRRQARRTRRPIHRSRPRPGSLSTRPSKQAPKPVSTTSNRSSKSTVELLVDGIPELRGRRELRPVGVPEGVAVGRRDEGRRQVREVDRGLRGQVGWWRRRRRRPLWRHCGRAAG